MNQTLSGWLGKLYIFQGFLWLAIFGSHCFALDLRQKAEKWLGATVLKDDLLSFNHLSRMIEACTPCWYLFVIKSIKWFHKMEWFYKIHQYEISWHKWSRMLRMNVVKTLKQMDSLSDWRVLSLELPRTRLCYHHLFYKFHFHLHNWTVEDIQNYPIKELKLTSVCVFLMTPWIYHVSFFK